MTVPDRDAVGWWRGTVRRTAPGRPARTDAVVLDVAADGTLRLDSDAGESSGTWWPGDRRGTFGWEAGEDLVDDGVVAGRIRIVQTATVRGDALHSTGRSVVLDPEGAVLREVDAVLEARRDRR